ncbi:MAG: hypothetical protein WCF30_15845 [Terracidiphilus sp.]
MGFGRLFAHSVGDTGTLKAAGRIVATDVDNDDALGAGLPALVDDLGDDFRIDAGGLLRGALPVDVGFEADDVLAADEAADAAHIFKRLLHQRTRLRTMNSALPPSELVAANALRSCIPDFSHLQNSTSTSRKPWTNTDAPIFTWIQVKWLRERRIELSTLRL